MPNQFRSIACWILLFATLPLSAQTAQDTAFTYQGELHQNNQSVTASVDMMFTLYDAATAGSVIGAPIALTAANSDPVQVTDGIFTVSLDFGAASFITMVNDARWLAVTVNGNPLSPRTKIENAPYALTSQLAYSVLAGSIGTTQINSAQVQRRISGACATGSSISVINQDGTISCQTAGSGTITGVTPAGGSGLTGGGASGSVSLGTDLTVLQKRVSGTCASGTAVSAVNADGSVACQSAGSSFTLPYSSTQSNAGPLLDITNTDTGASSTALQGTSNSTAANVSAVEGVISSTAPGLFSAGVRGVNNSTTGNGIGVYGTTAGSGPGVNGASASGPGVYGGSASGPGVVGFSTSSNSGYFASTTTTNTADTLYVSTSNSIATGVHSAAVNQGILGSANTSSGIGVQGYAFRGVVGQAPAAAVGGYGVAGYSYETTTANPLYVTESGPAGVYGSAAAPSGIGVYGIATDTTGGGGGPSATNFGVFGVAQGPQGIGVLGVASNVGVGVEASGTIGLVATGTQNAASFNGNVQINAFQPNSDIELTVQSQNPNNVNADIQLLPYNTSLTNYGFDISVGGTSASNLTFGIFQTPDDSAFNQVLGLDASGNLSIAGATATKPGGGSWSAPSDARLKRDIQPLDNILDKLLQLRGVTYEYRNPDGLHPPGRHTGFIAQEVRPIFPEWVGQTPDGYLSVGPTGFEAMTVEAFRELRAEKNAEIAELHKQMEQLTARLVRLEGRP